MFLFGDLERIEMAFPRLKDSTYDTRPGAGIPGFARKDVNLPVEKKALWGKEFKTKKPYRPLHDRAIRGK
jgi:hypothetical protein